MNEEWVAKDKEWIHGKEPKFLYLDIETSPLTMAAWGVYEQDALWHKMGEILMMGYMWGHEKTAHIVSQRQFDGWSPKKSKGKETRVCHQGIARRSGCSHRIQFKKFDIKEINARFMKYDISEPRYYALDPLNMIKRSARFPSHKLEDMAEYFKIGHKMQTGGKIPVEAMYGGGIWLRGNTWRRIVRTT